MRQKIDWNYSRIGKEKGGLFESEVNAFVTDRFAKRLPSK